MFKLNLKLILMVTAIILGAGFLFWKGNLAGNEKTATNAKEIITVYKSPTCGCCSGYVTYLKGEGFNVKVEEVRDTLSIKEKYGVPSDTESCHTSVIDGYVIEGHVPVEAIEKLLSEKPDIKGLALPGMLSGAPGMTGPKTGKLTVYGMNGGQPFEFFSF